jgi:hypothetical protein
MTNDALAMGPYVPGMHDHDDDDDEQTTSLKAPSVDSGKADRLNPEVEYDVLDLGGLSANDLKNKLNDLGKDGWQLVAASPSFIFRRLKKTDEVKLKKSVGFSV